MIWLEVDYVTAVIYVDSKTTGWIFHSIGKGIRDWENYTVGGICQSDFIVIR